jgi:hypothetical protein
LEGRLAAAEERRLLRALKRDLIFRDFYFIKEAMIPRISLPVIIVVVCCAALVPVASAKQKESAANAAAAQKRQAEADARAQADAQRTQMAQGFYNDLHEGNSNLTVDQIKTMNSEDIRRLYFHSYLAKGMTFPDAKSKSDALKIWDTN